jgi:hypothetical protein
MPMKPDLQDFEAVRQQYGRLPYNATADEIVEHYRLAQAAKLI